MVRTRAGTFCADCGGRASDHGTAVWSPMMIGPRGASSHRPMHPLEGYRRAAETRLDYIEHDLVSTKDGILIGRQEDELGSTTHATTTGPHRKRTKTVDGMSITG